MTIIDVDGVWNVRDVGGMPAEGGRIRAGALLRAGQLSRITPAGVAVLNDRIDHIIDLRGTEEVAAEPSGPIAADTTHLPLFLGSVRSFLETDISLENLYLHLLTHSGDRLVSAARIIAAGGGRTLVHCTLGKDRTGVTVALVLAAAGADRNAIVADYALTESQLPRERSRQIVAYLRARRPDAVHAVALATQSPSPVMRSFLETVDAQWGSAAGYFVAKGLTSAELHALREALIE